MNSCGQCEMSEFQGVCYHETFCPIEVARRRAIKDPKPGSHEMYEFVIQKTADDWAAGAEKRVEVAAKYDPKADPNRHVERCFTSSRYINDAAAESGLPVDLVRGIYHSLRWGRKPEDAVEQEIDIRDTRFEHPDDIKTAWDTWRGYSFKDVSNETPPVNKPTVRIVGPRHSFKDVKKIPAPVPADTLTTQDIAGIRADLDDVFTGEGDHKSMQPLSEMELKPVDKRLVAYLLPFKESDYSTYFSYPQRVEEELKKLFERKGRILEIAPLDEPKPDTKTARGEVAPRGGCGCLISFPPPEDSSILDGYPRAKELAQRRDGDKRLLPRVSFNDYKLALQLFFEYGFPLMGKAYASR